MINVNDAFAVMSIPDSVEDTAFIGAASLMRRVMRGANLADIINITAYNPNDANMLMGMSVIFQATGNLEMGMELQTKALARQRLYHLPAPKETAIRLLSIVTPGDMMSNTPVDFLLEDSNVAIDLFYVSLDMPFPASLPDHDVLMISVGQSDENLPLLERLGRYVEASSRPVINHPQKITLLSRNQVSALLKSAPGIEIPMTARLDRRALQQICLGEQSIANFLEDANFPIIVRPIASHGGINLAKLESPPDIENYLTTVNGDEFFIARFVDYRGKDGLYRKCRVALIEGKPFACHLGISDHWMIHYKNAGMSESADKRAQEEAFMASFDEDFAFRHRNAFRAIAERLGLDYLVIDCAETPDGKLLIFEADNLGFVHAIDPVDIFPYKQPNMRKVFQAFQAMLAKIANHTAG